MSYSRRSRYSPSPSPYKRRSVSRSISRSFSRSPSYSHSPSPYTRGRSISRSMSRGRSRSRSSSVENPGNNLYVTGLSPRITKRELEKHFSSEGEVVDVHLVMDPWTRESRGFGFVTMSSLKEADRCIKYLDGSVLEGRVITVEKARRRRGRTPTPGRYLGLKAGRGRHRSSSYSPRRSSGRGRSRSYSPQYRGRRYDSRSLTPRSRSPNSRRERSYSPYRGRHSYDEYSPYYRRDRSYSPYYRGRSRQGRSYSRSESDSEDKYYHSRSYRSSYRSRSIYIRRERRSYHKSPSPRPRKYYSSSPSRSPPTKGRGESSRRERSPSYATSASSRSVSRSVTPGSSS